MGVKWWQRSGIEFVLFVRYPRRIENLLYFPLFF